MSSQSENQRQLPPLGASRDQLTPAGIIQRILDATQRTPGEAAATIAAALAQAVRNRPDAALSDPELIADLIAGILHREGKTLQLSPDIAQEMHRAIAHVILQDPAASRRLNNVLHDLVGASDHGQ